MVMSGGSSVGEESVTNLTSRKVLAFRLADEEYGIDLHLIKEIIRPVEITRVPRVSDCIKGVISLRGAIIPVYDVRLRLGLPVLAQDRHSRFIIVECTKGGVGIIVDVVTAVITVSPSDIDPPPVVLGREKEYISGVGRYQGRLIILFDLTRVLSLAE